jgi:hypothetical protein
VADYFRLMLHTAALNRLIRIAPRRKCHDDGTVVLLRVSVDPPALSEQSDPAAEGVPVADPTLPVAALKGDERRRYHRYRRQRDPLGQGHIATWRTLLIKVAGEVTQSVRRILIRIPAQWPHLNWFNHVCQMIDKLRRNRSAQVAN